MKRLMACVTILLSIFCIEGVSAQVSQNTQKETREQKKMEQEQLDQLYFEEAKQAVESKDFILEADQVIFKWGTSAFVSSNTNFVAVKGDEAVVQVAFNVPFSGYNGLGGITVTGQVSDYKQKEDKNGNLYVTMNVMGTGISAMVSINLPKGTNRASVDISPNFNSNRFTLRGTLLPAGKANVFKGWSL